MRRIAITAPYLQLEWERYKHLFEGFEVIIPPVDERFEEEEMIEILSAGIEGVLCGDDRITKKAIDSASDLKVIVKWGTGIDSIDKEYANQKGIDVRNTPDAFIIPVTESAIGLMLSIVRKIDENNRVMHAGGWSKVKGHTLNELTVGIIGFGRIGSSVGRALSVFTDNVVWHDIKSDEELDPESITIGSRVSLDQLLKTADIITVHCDLNSTSEHLISSELMRKMKDGVILINTARGPIVNENDLVEGLKSGKIAYAGIDVFEEEPLPASSWLRSSNNCILLSHNTNSSAKYWERVHLNSISMLKEYFK